MATKKQKREIAEAKRAEFEAKVKEDGLKALKQDHLMRAQKEAELKGELDEHLQYLEEMYDRSLITRGIRPGTPLDVLARLLFVEAG